MIKSFASKETIRVLSRLHSTKLPQNIQHSAYKKLLMLDAATSLNDLRVPPGNRLEALHGKRKGQHSIRINDQWRLCFVWRQGDAFKVEIVDYH